MKNQIFRPSSYACKKSYNHSCISQNPISPNQATDPTNAIGYIPDIIYNIYDLSSPNESRTGVDLIYFPSLSRPVIVVSCGRHNEAECYLQFPYSDTGYDDFIFLSEYNGGYSNVSVFDDKVLFSGNTIVTGDTRSKIFRISSNGEYHLLWTDPTSKPIRNGCFVKNKSFDFIICGSLSSNSTLTEYYEYTGNDEWSKKLQFTTINNYRPFTVGIYGKDDQILIGNRVNNNYYDTQFISSFIISNNGSILKEIETFEPIVASYIGNIIPNKTQSDDYIFISGGQKNIRTQSFLLTPDNQKILLGPVMNGRNVIVFDFMKNGLQDIFIVCVTDPHILLLQTSIGYFEEYQIENTIGDNNGEARGATIGHLYNNKNTIEIIITDASEYHIPNQIYSFQYPIIYKPIYA